MLKILKTLVIFSVVVHSNFIYAQCGYPLNEFVVSVIPDNYPWETQWNIEDEFGNQIANGDANGDTLCLDASICYVLNLFDVIGDGIFPPGGLYGILEGDTVVAIFNFLGSQTSANFNCTAGTSCVDAIAITEGSYIAPSAEFWYSFTAPFDGQYNLNTCQAATTCDTRLYVYENCNGNISAEDNAGTNFYNNDFCNEQSQIIMPLAAGSTVLIRIGDTQNECATQPIEWEITYIGAIEGCTDSTACNYQPLATSDDGSCIAWGSPDCPAGPDLTILENTLQLSLHLDSVFNTDNCTVQEGCLKGFGWRKVLRFTTHIKNIGEQDFFIGAPSANPSQFSYDNCHGHYHYSGYSEYALYDTLGNYLPVGFKNGFCVLDLECNNQASFKYSCNNQGLSAGCGDIYASNLDCQWIDITDVADGKYTLIVRVNWDQSADALGRIETDFSNNAAQACIEIFTDTNGNKQFVLSSNCPTFYDCAGIELGNTSFDCEGVCAGNTIAGDIDQNDNLDSLDFSSYVDGILNENILINNCNDLSADGTISLFDAALISNCLNFGNNHIHTDYSSHAHCNFNGGVENILDTVFLKILEDSLENGFITLGIKNVYSRVLGYQLQFENNSITNAENYLLPDFPITPSFNFNGEKLIGFSRVDSTIDKGLDYKPFLKIYFEVENGTEICINQNAEVINAAYEKVITIVEGECANYLVSNKNFEQQVLRVFPNPFSDVANIYFDSEVEKSIDIYDANGNIVFQKEKLQVKSFKLTSANLNAGIYYLRVKTRNNIYFKQLIVF